MCCGGHRLPSPEYETTSLPYATILFLESYSSSRAEIVIRSRLPRLTAVNVIDASSPAHSGDISTSVMVIVGLACGSFGRKILQVSGSRRGYHHHLLHIIESAGLRSGSYLTWFERRKSEKNRRSYRSSPN